MVNHSTLRQGVYTPGWGSVWGWFQHENGSLRTRFEECFKVSADKEWPSRKQVEQTHVERPHPCWSVDRVADWIHERCGAVIGNPCLHAIIDPAPDLTTTDQGLFPVFHDDAFGVSGVPGVQQWIFDSGATSTCSNNLAHFKNLSHNVPFNRIRVANNSFAQVKGIGDVDLEIVDEKSNTTFTLRLRNVLYIPDVPVCLISTRSMWRDSGITSTFADTCTITLRDAATSTPSPHLVPTTTTVSLVPGPLSSRPKCHDSSRSSTTSTCQVVRGVRAFTSLQRSFMRDSDMLAPIEQLKPSKTRLDCHKSLITRNIYLNTVKHVDLEVQENTHSMAVFPNTNTHTSVRGSRATFAALFPKVLPVVSNTSSRVLTRTPDT